MNVKVKATLMILFGMVGMTCYQVALSYPHPGWMETDLFHGFWLALFLLPVWRGYFIWRMNG